MSEAKDTFEARVSRLGNYIIRAHKYDKPSILFALYMSDFLRADVEISLEKSIKEHGLKVMSVDAGRNKDIPTFISSMNSDNTVFLVHNIENGFPEVLPFLNFKREELVEHHAKVLFWVKEEELARISLEAPDFFAFRSRVVEFMEVPMAEERRPALVEFASEIEYKSLDEIKRSIELKEKLLAELSNEAEISGYLLGSLGVLYSKISSYKKSIEYSEKALRIAQEIGNKRHEGAELGNLGIAYFLRGDTQKAIEYYEKALKIAQEIADREGESIRLGNLGSAYAFLGNAPKAIGYYEKALKIAQEIGDKQGEGVCLGNLGIAIFDMGDMKKATDYFEKALKIAQEIEDKTNESVCLGNLGRVFTVIGDTKKATDYFEKALKIAQEIGERKNEGAFLNNLGIIFKTEKKYKEAIACYLLAKDIRTQIGDPYLEKTEISIKKLKEELSEFETLEAEVAPRAAEIVKKILEGDPI